MAVRRYEVTIIKKMAVRRYEVTILNHTSHFGDFSFLDKFKRVIDTPRSVANDISI